MNLLPKIKKKILRELKSDMEFFQRNNINDYSLLLGIHNLRGGKREARRILKKSKKVMHLIESEHE